MAKVSEGDKVRIKTYEKRPGFWNPDGEMDWLMGQVVEVSSVFNGDCIHVKSPRTGKSLHWAFEGEHYDVLDERMISIW